MQQEGTFIIVTLSLDMQKPLTYVFNNLDCVLMSAIIDAIEQRTRCECIPKVGKPPDPELPDVILAEVPDAFSKKADSWVQNLVSYPLEVVNLFGNYYIRSLIIYKQCPKHYLVIERQSHGTVSCYDSLKGVSPLPDSGCPIDCYVSVIVLVSCSPARELPSIPLQDAFAKQWGPLKQEHNRRRNRLDPAPTEVELEANLEVDLEVSQLEKDDPTAPLVSS